MTSYQVSHRCLHRDSVGCFVGTDRLLDAQEYWSCPWFWQRRNARFLERTETPPELREGVEISDSAGSLHINDEYLNAYFPSMHRSTSMCLFSAEEFSMLQELASIQEVNAMFGLDAQVSLYGRFDLEGATEQDSQRQSTHSESGNGCLTCGDSYWDISMCRCHSQLD